MRLTRRTFLISSAGVVGAGALVLAWKVPRLVERQTPRPPLHSDATHVPLNGWVMIDRDDLVTIVMSKAEMGQGIHTGAAMLLAEELGADWGRVRVIDSPIDAIYRNYKSLVSGLPFRADDHGIAAESWRMGARVAAVGVGTMATGGSTSISDLWMPMREAGASARVMLCNAAAHWWRVDPYECEARNGRVLGPGNRVARFSELIDYVKHEAVPSRVTLKDPKHFTIIGQSFKRLDIEARSKTDGSAKFGIDVLLDGMLYASVAMCPVIGGDVVSVDLDKVKGMPGVHDQFTIGRYNGSSGGVAVIADNPYIAMRACCTLDATCKWDGGSAAKINDRSIWQRLNGAFDAPKPDDKVETYYSVGEADVHLNGPGVVMSTYDVPYLAHGALEPVNCTARVTDDHATLWVSTQIPQAARQAVAKYLGFAEAQVEVNRMLLGGGFGRRLEVDYIVQAVEIARHRKGTPVQTIWPRAQDTTHDFYRPAAVSRFKARVTPDGKLLAWRNDSVGQAVNRESLPRAFGQPKAVFELIRDASTTEGAFDQPYECENLLVTHTSVSLPVPVGSWRSVGHSQHAFFVESFIDELAASIGKDPIQFRLGLLTQKKHARHVAVLDKMIAFSNWNVPLPRASRQARGVALHESFGSIVAQVAEIEACGNHGFRVTRVYCVIDCGIAVNPNLVQQQMESGIVFGLSAALQQRISFANGQVQQRYFSDFPLVKMSNCPEIRTAIIESDRDPQGVGEAGTSLIAPAVANAIYALSKKRCYSLPFMAPPQPPQEDVWCTSASTAALAKFSPPPTLRCFGY